MSSPCWVDKAGPVLAYRTMHLNDVVSASSPMISLDIKYSTHLVGRTHTIVRLQTRIWNGDFGGFVYVFVDKSPKVYTQLAREGVVLTQDSDNI